MFSRIVLAFFGGMGLCVANMYKPICLGTLLDHDWMYRDLLVLFITSPQSPLLLFPKIEKKSQIGPVGGVVNPLAKCDAHSSWWTSTG